MPEPFKANIDIRFRDLDAMGHVNNAVFLTYFEEGRKQLFHAMLDISEPSDFAFILAHIRCDFLKPVMLDSKLTLEIWVHAIGTKRFDLRYRLVDRMDNSLVYAQAASAQVCYNYQHNRTVPVSDSFRTKLSEYLTR